MDQFRQIGEVLGSLKALMVLKDEIQINQRQCCLLLDLLDLAFQTISEEIKQNLRLDERHTKWKALELPMRELHKIFKDADSYVRYCLDVRDWWGKAISLHMNKDCVDFHIHNLLCCFPVVIEAIESAAEISGVDQEEMQKKRLALMKKYYEELDDPKIFQWKFGKQYLVPREICSHLDSALKEDRWLLLEKIKEKKTVNSAKHEQRLGELLIRKLTDTESLNAKVLPSNVLLGAYDYFVKRRLGSGRGHYKEINWLGESFALKTFYGDIQPLNPEISSVLSLSHPNILQHHCAFYDEERKEGFLVMELMHKDLYTYIKENNRQRKRVASPIPTAVDIMLQIARGMEYLHSRKIYHGDLNPSNILLKAHNASTENLFQAKITGFGLTSIKGYTARSPRPTEFDPCIWLAPEVLAEQEQPGGKGTARYMEKADVYSFGMLCFELLTGKVPFEDSHLQGEKMARNIRAGERPLFPYPSPKYLANLTRKCWQANPDLRPTFSSICRILRYIKRTLVINPDHGQPDCPPPLVDYCDMEAGYLKKFPGELTADLAPVSHIPFQMFAYRLVEKEKISGKNWDLAMDGSFHHFASVYDDEQFAMDELFLPPSDRRSVCSEIIERKNSAMDLRSVISEIPHRKLFLSDQRSVGSESPGRTYPGPAGDQRSMYAGETPERKSSLLSGLDQSSPLMRTPENKTFQRINSQKTTAENLEKAILLKASELRPVGSRTPRNKNSLNKSAKKTEIIEEEESEQSPMKNDEPDSTVEKSSSQEAKGQESAETPSNETLGNIRSNTKEDTISQPAPEKKSRPAAKNIHKSRQVKNPEKKNSVTTNMKDTRTSTFSGTRSNNSPRSSPARMNKTNPLMCSAFSPARTKKKNPFYSPTSSPARIRKANPNSSPAPSPARASTACSSAKCAPAYASNENSLPLSSCQQCSRHGRESLLR